MKLQLGNLLTNAGRLADADDKAGLGLQMDVGIVSWPEIELEVSDHFYVIFW